VVVFENIRAQRVQFPKLMIRIQSPTDNLGSVQPAVTSVKCVTEAFILAFHNSINLQGVVLMYLVTPLLSNLRGCRSASP
jgi:hypothetical protein